MKKIAIVIMLYCLVAFIWFAWAGLFNKLAYCNVDFRAAWIFIHLIIFVISGITISSKI